MAKLMPKHVGVM